MYDISLPPKDGSVSLYSTSFVCSVQLLNKRVCRIVLFSVLLLLFRCITATF